MGRKCWPWKITRDPPYDGPFEGSSLIGEWLLVIQNPWMMVEMI
jgi:hypothetical protein